MECAGWDGYYNTGTILVEICGYIPTLIPNPNN